MISVKNLTKIYNDKIVVNNISFEINNKEIICLLGPNGAGKTTTILMLLGLLSPDSGDILMNNDNKKNYSDIAYLPDNPICYEELSVEENIFFISKLYNKDYNIVSNIIDRLDLKEHLKKFPKDLSKGNKQKLSICIVLLRDFKVLIADEPFTGLDPQIIKELKDIFIELRKEGKTIIVSTHLLDLAETFCDKYLLINKGNLLGFGDKKSLCVDESLSLEEIFLDKIALSEEEWLCYNYLLKKS